MSHKHGKYLGGIRTVECLRQRSRVDPDTGCWHWGLSLTRGVPIVHLVTPDTGERMKIRGRRAALYLQKGSDLPSGRIAFAKTICHSDDCVNPDHSRLGTKAQFCEWLSKTGRIGGHKSSVASIETWNRRGRRITPEMVKEIRSTDENTHALAKRLGVSQCAVWLCRSGKTHKHITVGPRAASVFDWRPAA